MRIVPFKQVDVFTSKPFVGNPVAVVFGADGLDSADMQRLAAWTNLSETTFVLAPTVPGADYRLRIFTTRQELPFAGHPSVGSAHAAIEAGWANPHGDRLVQECAAGLLPIRIEDSGEIRRLFVRAPAAEIEDSDLMLTHALGKALGVPLRSEPGPRAINVGPVWLIADLEQAQIVDRLEPDMAALAALCRDRDAVGVTVFGRTGRPDVLLAVRSFAPADSIPEDPVCGSGNAAIAAYLYAGEQLPPSGARYIAAQGQHVGRDGYVHVTVDADGRIEIGGEAVTCVDGTIRL
jgi:PhzF family phenazine biosynthesis protein